MPERDDAFLGAWLVTEHVFTPAGAHLGDVAQRRTLRRLASGHIEVRQVCEPQAALAGHPMAAFAGEWVFELAVDGARRRYLGPDVIGYGTEWAPGAMTGQGAWPRFGCGFRSWSMLTAPDRQLTGGWFDVAGRPVAAIVGVAVAESAGAAARLDLRATAPLPDDLPPSARHHRTGPLLVIDSWDAPEVRTQTFVVADAAAGVTATLALTESSGGSSAAFAVRIG